MQKASPDHRRSPVAGHRGLERLPTHVRRLRSQRARGLELEPARRPRSRESRAAASARCEFSRSDCRGDFAVTRLIPGDRRDEAHISRRRLEAPIAARSSASRGDAARPDFVERVLRGAPSAVSRERRCVCAPGEGLEGARGRARAAESRRFGARSGQKAKIDFFGVHSTDQVARAFLVRWSISSHTLRPTSKVQGYVARSAARLQVLCERRRCGPAQ